MNWGSVVSSGDGKDEPVINHPEAREIFAAVRLNPKKQPTLRNYCMHHKSPAISQGGLDLWLEQASDFFAGRQRCI
jgi:hypothetical protein